MSSRAPLRRPDLSNLGDWSPLHPEVSVVAWRTVWEGRGRVTKEAILENAAPGWPVIFAVAHGVAPDCATPMPESSIPGAAWALSEGWFNY